MKETNTKVLLFAFIIFLTALGLRIVNLEIIKDNPFFRYPIMDEKYHDEWAQEIAEGSLFERAPFYRAPGYPLLLGMIYAVFGHRYYTARLMGVILGSLSCLLIFIVGKEVYSLKVGILAGFLACFYSMLIYFDSMLLTTYLELFFCLFAFLFLLMWFKKKTALNIILTGICWGLATITRPNFLIFVPVLAIYMFCILKEKSLKERLAPVILFTAGMIPAVLTVLIINVVVGKDTVLIAWNGGINFYLGNNLEANGWSATSPEIDATWWGGYKDAILIAERDCDTHLLPSEVSDYWFKRGFQYIFAEPYRWAGLMIKKAYLLLNSYELSNNQSIATFTRFSPLLQFPLLSFGIIFALGIMGFIVSTKDKKVGVVALFVLSYSLGLILFFIPARYRMPLVPFLLVFASHSIFWLIQRFKEKALRQVMLSIIAITVMTTFAHTNFYHTHSDMVNSSEVYASFGNRYFEHGDYDKAIVEYQKALKYNPYNGDAMNALANTYLALGRNNKAIMLFKQSLSIKENADAFCKLGIINFQQGMIDSAQIYFAKAITVDSTNPEVYYYIGMSHAFGKKPHLAIKYLETSLQYYPDPKYLNNIYYNLGKLCLEVGNKKEAKQYLLKAGLKYKDVPRLLEMTK